MQSQLKRSWNIEDLYGKDKIITYYMTPMLMNESIIANFESRSTQATDYSNNLSLTHSC